MRVEGKREKRENRGMCVILIWLILEFTKQWSGCAVWCGWLRIPNIIRLFSPSFLRLGIRREDGETECVHGCRFVGLADSAHVLQISVAPGAFSHGLLSEMYFPVWSFKHLCFRRLLLRGQNNSKQLIPPSFLSKEF